MQTATDVGDELLGARLSPLARLLVIAASIVIILAGLKAAAEIAAPILFAIFLATLASPLLQGLENRGLSTARALAVMIAGTLALGGGFVALIYLSVRQILILPSAANAGALGAARSSLAGLGLNGTLEPANILSDRFVLQASGAILHAVSSAVLQLVILITLFVFFLIAFPRFRSTELADHVDSSPLFAPLLAVRQDLWSFLVIRTKVNAFMAIPATIFLVAAGIDFALLWGVLLFVFSFIPYIGFALATIPPALLGWIEVRAYRGDRSRPRFCHTQRHRRIRALPSIRRQRAQHPAVGRACFGIFLGLASWRAGHAYSRAHHVVDSSFAEQLYGGALACRCSWGRRHQHQVR